MRGEATLRHVRLRVSEHSIVFQVLSLNLKGKRWDLVHAHALLFLGATLNSLQPIRFYYRLAQANYVLAQVNSLYQLKE